MVNGISASEVNRMLDELRQELTIRENPGQYYAQADAGGQTIQLTGLIPGNGGNEYEYDGKFAVFRNDDLQVWILAGVAELSSLSTNIAEVEEFDITLIGDGLYYLYHRLYYDLSGDLTHDTICNKTRPARKWEEIEAIEEYRNTYPITCAEITILDSIITGIEQVQWGYHQVAGVMS